MAFAGCERFGQMFCDQRCGEAWPGGEMSALDCPKKSGRKGTESTCVEKCGKVLFCCIVLNGTVGSVSGLRWYGFGT